MDDPAVEEEPLETMYLMQIIPSYICINSIELPTIAVLEGKQTKKHEQNFGYGQETLYRKALVH